MEDPVSTNLDLKNFATVFGIWIGKYCKYTSAVSLNRHRYCMTRIIYEMKVFGTSEYVKLLIDLKQFEC